MTVDNKTLKHNQWPSNGKFRQSEEPSPRAATNAGIKENSWAHFLKAFKSHAQSMSSKPHYNMSRDIMPRQEIDIDFTR